MGVCPSLPVCQCLLLVQGLLPPSAAVRHFLPPTATVTTHLGPTHAAAAGPGPQQQQLPTPPLLPSAAPASSRSSTSSTASSTAAATGGLLAAGPGGAEGTAVHQPKPPGVPHKGLSPDRLWLLKMYGRVYLGHVDVLASRLELYRFYTDTIILEHVLDLFTTQV